MNGLYDPDITLVGQQCEYYDFWTQLYQTYIVLDSEIRITFENTSSSPVTGVLFPSISAGFGPSLTEAMMLPYSKHVTTAALGGAPTRCTLTAKGLIGYGLSLFVAQAPLRYRRETLTGVSSAPIYPIYWNFRAYQAAGSPS